MEIREIVDEMMEEIVVAPELKERILDKTVRAGWVKKGFFHRAGGIRRSMVLAAAAILFLMAAVTVTAVAVKSWNRNAVKNFPATAEQQEELLEEGYADNLSEREAGDEEILSATDNGITVSVKQTVSDGYCLYIYLEVEAEDNLELPVAMDIITFGESDMGTGFPWTDGSGGSHGIKDDPRKCGYGWYCIGNEQVDVNGRMIGCHLKDIEISEAETGKLYVVEGEWNLQWSGSNSIGEKVIEVNQTLQEEKGETRLKKLYISPLSYKLTYEMDEGLAADWNHEWKTVMFHMKDGTVFDPSNEMRDPYRTKKQQIEFFGRVLDMEEIDSIVIGEGEAAVEVMME